MEMLQSQISASSGEKPLLEFWCGKCNWDGRIVTPDPRKGMLQLDKGEDGLLHVQWMTRVTKIVEDDLIVMHDAYLERINDAKTGRIYVLKFATSDKKLIFWLQYKDQSKDEENISLFNHYAGGAPTSANEGSSSSSSLSSSEPPVASSVPTPHLPSTQSINQTDDATATTSSYISEESLLSLIEWASRLSPKRATNESNIHEEQYEENRNRRQRKPISFNSLLPIDVILKLLDDPEALSEMQTYMPTDLRSIDDLKEAIRSPQMQTAMANFTREVYSECFPMIISSMGLNLDSNPSSPFAYIENPIGTMVDLLEQSYGAAPDSNFNALERLIDNSDEPPCKKNKKEEENEESSDSTKP